MGFTEVLTIIFVLLKCFEVVTWSWWVVFLPEIIAVALYLLFFILGLCGVGSTYKKVKKSFKDFDF
jgi:hypothetical protein